jgi:small-conductance mechanosensitive channel
MEAGVGTFGLPGSGFLPFWSAAILGVLAIILTIKGFNSKRVEQKTIELPREAKRSRVILALISLLAYAILLERAGYLVMTFGLMIFLYMIAGRSKVWIQIVSAAITVLVTYVVFYRWLGVQLPRGIFSF